MRLRNSIHKKNLNLNIKIEIKIEFIKNLRRVGTLRTLSTQKYMYIRMSYQQNKQIFSSFKIKFFINK